MDKGTVFISYYDPRFKGRYNVIVKENMPYLLTVLNEKANQGAEIFKSWALLRGSNVVEQSAGAGVIEMFPAYLDELAKKWREYDILNDTKLAVGVGKTLKEAEVALEEFKNNPEGGIQFYSEALLHKPKKEEDKPIGEVVDELLSKAEPNFNSLIDSLHEHADKGEQEIDPKEINSKIVESLKILKENMPVIKELQNNAPDLYQALLNLSQTVVKLAESMQSESKDSESEAQEQSPAKLPGIKADKAPQSPDTESHEGKVKVYHPVTGRTSWRRADVSRKASDPNVVVEN